jgi:multiple sugar transport system substrate-binding protein
MTYIRNLTRTGVAVGAMFAAIGTATADAPEPTPTFDNVTVTVALHSGGFEIAWGVHKDRIKELYGINMEIVGIPVNELFDKEILELSTGSGAFDLVQFNPGWMGDYVDFLEPLDALMDRWDPAWEDVHEGFRIWENTYQGKRYSMTMDGDILFTYFNRNLFEDSGEKAAFRTKYGYDLGAPQTWDQVIDIQEFFRRDTNGDGEIDHWGYSDPIIKRGRGFYSFLLRYINYYGPNPQYMDPDTLVPLINNEAGIQALENYKRTVELGPPGMLAWEWDEAHAAFMQGRVATLVHWPDEGLMTDIYRANTGAEMGFAKMPGAMVRGSKMERTMTGGGWIIGLSADSRNKEAAYTLMRHILSPETSLHLVLMPGTDIFRTSQFEHPVIKQVAPAEYLDVYQQSITDNFPELRIPGGFEYYDALDVAVQKALAGQSTVEEALDDAAAQWEKITDRIGRDGQRAAYKAAMGL